MSSKQKFSSSAMQSTQTNGGETSGGAVGVCVVGGCSHGGEVRQPFLISQGTVQATPPRDSDSSYNWGKCKGFLAWVLLENMFCDISMIRGDTLTECRFSLCIV